MCVCVCVCVCISQVFSKVLEVTLPNNQYYKVRIKSKVE